MSFTDQVREKIQNTLKQNVESDKLLFDLIEYMAREYSIDDVDRVATKIAGVVFKAEKPQEIKLEEDKIENVKDNGYGIDDIAVKYKINTSLSDLYIEVYIEVINGAKKTVLYVNDDVYLAGLSKSEYLHFIELKEKTKTILNIVKNIAKDLAEKLVEKYKDEHEEEGESE